ncbi:MAG: MFS transporter [Pseudomonadota bacterium]|nr:MFS transporter [Pseudomonadota bacterium]
MTSRAGRVSPLHIISYVLPAAPLAALGLPIVVHLPQFYASGEIGLSLALTGLVFSLCRIADVFVDPTMGYISDRLSTRWGRRRPMVVAGTPLLLVGIWMVFVPGGPVGPVYLAFWLFVMYVAWSMVTIPLLSWGAELSSDYHERSRIYGWNQVSIIAGMVGVLVVPAVLENLGYPRTMQIMAMAVFAILLLVPSVALCAGALPEPQVRLRTHAALAPTLRFLYRNAAFRRVIAVDLIVTTSAGAIGAMFFFFARFVLALPQWAGTLLLVYFISGCIFVPFWISLSRRIGKHRALMASFAYTVVVMPLYLLVPPGHLWAALPVFVLSGMNYGAPSFLLRSMMADIADADTAENGAERAGLMYSFLALTDKFGLGWAVGICFVLLAWLGFDPKTINPPEAIAHMRALYISLPIVFGIANFFILRAYPLDEDRQRVLRLEVERRRVLHASTAAPEAASDIGDVGIAKGTP